MSLKWNAIRLAEEHKHAQWPVERIDYALNKLRIIRNGEAHMTGPTFIGRIGNRK